MSKQKKALIAICCISIIGNLPGVTQSLLAYIMKSYPSVDPATVTSLLSLPSLASLLAAFTVGALAVKIEKKKLMLLFGAFAALHMAITAVVGANGPFALLLVAGLFGGLWAGSFTTLNTSLINDHIAAEKQPSIIARSMAIANGGLALVNILFGAIGSGNGGANWPLPYFIGAILVLLCATLFVIFLPKGTKASAEVEEKQEKTRGLQLSGWNPLPVIILLAMSAFYLLASSAFFLNVSGYIVLEHQLGSGTETGIASALMTITGMVAGLSFTLWEKLFKKWLATFGLVLMGAGLASMLLITNSLAGIFAGAVLLGFGLNLLAPNVMAKLMASSPAPLVPMVISAATAVAFLANFIAPTVLGAVGALFGGGSRGAFITGIILVCIGFVISLFVFGAKKQEVPQER